jgi:hypothetical protein
MATPTLHALPHDLQASIAAELPPAGLLALAATCHALAPLAASPALWRHMHARHMPPTSGAQAPRRATKATFAAAAAAHVARFHISNSAILPNTPVHLHSNTVQAVRASGGSDKSTAPDARIAYYVVPHDVRRPGFAPGIWDGAVELLLRAAPAHPADGVVVRIVHGLQAEVGCGGAGGARVEVVVNGTYAETVAAADARVGEVGVSEVHVPGAAIKAGAPNTIAARFYGVDGVSWWLREVAVAPVVVGLPPWTEQRASLPVAVPLRREPSGDSYGALAKKQASKIRVHMHGAHASPTSVRAFA